MRYRRSRAHAILIAACAPLLGACPLPIARTEVTSPPVIGQIYLADGTPLSDAEIAVSTDWNDTACAKAALRTRTDAAGAFQLPQTVKRYGTTWFVPNLHPARPRFELCAAVRDTLRHAYTGRGSLYEESADSDSLSCVAWEWETGPRVNCVGRTERGVVTGGRWTDSAGGSEGFYRVFLTDEPTRVKGYDKDKPQDRPYVYVQWVEPRAAGLPESAQPPYRVHATVTLPFDRNKVWTIQEVQLWRHEGRWLASLHGYKHAFMNDMARAEIIFELGAPGQATRIAGP